MSEEKQYAERDLMAMDIAGNHYCRHIDHMTREQLHSKSDIAAELGWRDMQISELKAQRDALAAENTNLLPKAASELSNAWVLHKFWIGINAALMHMQVGRSYEAEQWLKGTIAGPGLEAPNLKLSDEIDAWANEQGKDSISHLRALEIIKAETPATAACLNSVRAEGVEILTGKLQQLIDEGVFDAKEIGVAAGAVHEGAQIAAQLRAAGYEVQE